MARQTIQNANASLYLNGTSGYMTSTTLPDLTGFNISIWYKPGAYPGTEGNIICHSIGSTGFRFMVEANSTQLYAAIYTDAGVKFVNFKGAGFGRSSQWSNLVLTSVPGSHKGYLNGVLVDTEAGTIVPTSSTYVRIGATNAPISYSSGNVSNYVLHNTTTPWTAAQVLALYNNGTVPTGATAVYPLSEGAGTVAYDTSGNGNNGTITAGTWSRDTPTKTRKGVNGNMVYNGDFEIVPPAATNVATTTGGMVVDGTAAGASAVGDSPFGWMIWNYTGSYAAKFDTSVKYSGNASMKISTTATSSTVGLRNGISGTAAYRYRLIPILPSTSYTYSVWIKTQVNSGAATTGMRYQLAQIKGGDLTATTTITAVTGVVTTQDWTQYTGTFTSASEARYITPSLQIVGNDGTGTLIMDAWFDDIQLYPTTAITRSAATGRLAATGRSAA